MTETSPDGKIEIHVCVFSNNFLYGSLIGECRKNSVKKTDVSKKPKRKDPEENLGNVVATLDTDKIERGVDFIDIERTINSLIEKNNIAYDDYFSDIESVEKLCVHYELKLKDLISLMLEHRPDVFTLSFLKTVIKPLVAKINEAKYNYENENELCKGYQPIFDLL